MTTFTFKSERNWDRAYEALDKIHDCRFCSYGYKAITVFNETAEKNLKAYCATHRISISEI